MRNRIILLAAMAFTLLTGSCDHNVHEYPKKTFVLVHGAWQSSYVWQEVKKNLEEKGQNVLTVELPAHGDDGTSPAAVSMQVYTQKVVDAIKTVNGKVILVGHSMGGVVVSSVAEAVPERIEKLIYIGAFVPASGQSLLDLALTDAQSELGPNLIPSEDQLTLDIVHDKIISIFCQDASADAQNLVLAKYKVEPAIPFADKITLTAKRYGVVDKYYIHTLMDHAIGADLQARMVSAASIRKEYSINTGHSPFLSKPEETASLFLQIAFK
ncbi:MAG: alpha/beta fold hydrolase [Chitinophagaceae bacterium]